MKNSAYSGLDLLASAVLLLTPERRACYTNPAAEALFGFSLKQVMGLTLEQIFSETDSLLSAVEQALHSLETTTEHELQLSANGHETQLVSCTITPWESGPVRLALEFTPLEKQLRIAREERMLLASQANREFIRNLAHEIRNPLGGLRGAAQLLEAELPRPGLREYTQVIIKEADRLQALMDRLLTPNRPPQLAHTNIHEVLERVRSLVLAETPSGIAIRRDYDTSLPDLMADKEQLIQAVLNIVRNAAQALHGQGEIVLRTRVARQVTIAKKRHALALQVQVIDNGPGVPESIRERIFYPLVSGRDGGSGLGLTLAQTFVQQHQGSIECDSRPGRTCFMLTLPLDTTNTTNRISGQR